MRRSRRGGRSPDAECAGLLMGCCSSRTRTFQR
jgi:hypothetical protein